MRTRRTDDGTYPNVEEELNKLDERANARVLKRVSIVFQETGNAPGGKGFQVFLEGIDNPEEVNKMTPEEQLHKLSTAEFWALRCFQLCAHVMQQAGAVHSATKKGSG